LRRIELKVYNGRWLNRGVLARIRRKVERSIDQGECIVLDGEDVVGLELPSLQMIVTGLPDDKLCLAGIPALRVFPLPGGAHAPNAEI